ncbi:MAG: hypothetical protein ACI8XX_001747, partial [Polaribacter sp.]
FWFDKTSSPSPNRLIFLDLFLAFHYSNDLESY